MLETLSIADAVRTAFPFTVDKFRLQGPDNMRTDHFGLFRSDSRECTGRACKEIYVAHQTDDVVALVEAAQTVFGEGDTDVQCHWRDGHYVTVSPSRDIRKSLAGGKDNNFPRLIIRAGYDGKAFSTTLGLYRDVCSNLMMMRHVAGTTTTIRHTSGLRGKMDDLITDFESLQGGWQAVQEYIDNLSNRQVALQDFLEHLYPTPKPDASQNTVTRHKNTISAIVNRCLREHQKVGQNWTSDQGKLGVSAWMAYNAVTGFVEHDKVRKTRKGEPAAGQFDRSILAMNDSVVAKADNYLHRLVTA
jgi:hypothetical protein